MPERHIVAVGGGAREGLTAYRVGAGVRNAAGREASLRVERRRAEARVLRQEADERTRRAEEREAVAGHIADEARAEREHAQKLAQRAGKLDPATAHTGQEDEADADRQSAGRRVFSR